MNCSLLPTSEDQSYCKNPSSDPAWQVTGAFCQMQESEVQLSNDDDRLIKIQARFADDLSKRMAGYQFIGSQVIKKTVILFLFPSEILGAFHMCNVLTPLDIAWIHKDGSILDVQTMQPGPIHAPLGCPALYAPKRSEKYRYALEARQGFFNEIRISVCSEEKREKCKARLIIQALP